MNAREAGKSGLLDVEWVTFIRIRRRSGISEEAFFFWTCSSNHCLAALDLMGRYWAAIRLSHRPESSGHAVHEEVGGLDIGGQHGRRFVLRHTHKPQRRSYPICTRSRTQAVLGRVTPGGVGAVSGMKMRSLVGLSVHSAFHWWSSHCIARVLI